MDSTHPLRLVRREGQAVGARTIKTLSAFLSGATSPGQGCGWLVQEATGPRVLALAFLNGTPAAQAVVRSGFGAVPSVVADATTAPGIAGANFATFGLPAAEAQGGTAFLASLKVAPGIATTANARALFADDGTAAFAKIARVTEPAPATGASFSLLKDPVLADGGDLAFPATLKANTVVKAAATTTLWWRPAGAALTLLAQSGGANGVTNDLRGGAQWKTFPSLAIAGGGRGPIITATLVAGKGGVLAKNANGVWAMDFAGTLRTLFRTNDPITVNGTTRTLKSFLVLKTAVGSLGVTRNFNDAAQVTWLATFTDKTTAIVMTEVP